MSGRTQDPVTGLTPQQEAFCLGLVKHGNATQAYRDAYPNQRMNPNSLAVAACKLQALPKVSLRLVGLRSEARKHAGITLAEHLDTLAAIRQEARAAMQYGAAVSAETARGKASGLYDAEDDSSDVPVAVNVTVNVVDGRKSA